MRHAHPCLGVDEQQRLAARYAATHDPQIAARLVAANQRLVIKIARRYGGGPLPLADVVQEGNVGLLLALGHYDPRRGVKLSSYAAWWIRAYVLRHLVRNYRLVRLGTTQRERHLFFNLGKVTRRLSSDGVEPSAVELARALRTSPHRIVEMSQRMAAPELPLDRSTSDGEPSARAWSERLSAPASLRPDVLAEAHELGDVLRAHVVRFSSTLHDRDRTLVQARWLNDEPASLAELAAELGISREQARRREQRLLGQLRQRMGDLVSR